MDPQLVAELVREIDNTKGLEFRPALKQQQDRAFQLLLGHLRETKTKPQDWRLRPKLCQDACRVLRPVLFNVAVADAADVLATMGSTARKMVSELVEAITSGSTLTNHNLSRVVRALGRVGLSEDEAVDAVIRVLEQYRDAEEDSPEGPDGVAPGVEAARALGRLRRSHPDAVLALQKVCELTSVHPRVLLAAGTALWHLGGPEGDRTLTPDRETAVNAVSDCLAAAFQRDSAEGHRRAEQRSQAAGSAQLEAFLHGTVVAPSPPVPPAPFPEPAVRVLAARRLRRFGPEAIAAAANRLTIAALADEADVRKAARAALAHGGYTDRRERRRILIESLATDESLLGPFASLGSHLATGPAGVQSHVLRAYVAPLARVGRDGRTRGRAPHRPWDHAALLVRNGGGPLINQLLNFLADLPAEEREAVAHLLRHLAETNRTFLAVACSNTIPCFRQHLASPAGWIRLDTAVALWHSSPTPDDRRESLVSLTALLQAKTEPERLRTDTAWSLGELGSAASVIPALEAVERDDSEPRLLRNQARRSRERLLST